MGCKRRWPVRLLQRAHPRAHCRRVNYDSSVLAKHAPRHRANITSCVQGGDKRDKGVLTLAAKPIVRAGQLQQLPRKQAEAAAADDDRAVGPLPDSGAQGDGVVKKSLLRADQHVIDVADGNPYEIRTVAIQDCVQTVRIHQFIKPDRVMTGLAQRCVKASQSQREDRVGRCAAICADQKNTAWHSISIAFPEWRSE